MVDEIPEADSLTHKTKFSGRFLQGFRRRFGSKEEATGESVTVSESVEPGIKLRERGGKMSDQERNEVRRNIVDCIENPAEAAWAMWAPVRPVGDLGKMHGSMVVEGIDLDWAEDFFKMIDEELKVAVDGGVEFNTTCMEYLLREDESIPDHEMKHLRSLAEGGVNLNDVVLNFLVFEPLNQGENLGFAVKIRYPENTDKDVVNKAASAPLYPSQGDMMRIS